MIIDRTVIEDMTHIEEYCREQLTPRLSLRTIMVATQTDDVKRPLTALVLDDGIWAIHPTPMRSYDVDEDEWVDAYSWDDYWSVTHVPSGASAVQGINRHGIWKALWFIMDMKWKDTPVSEMKTCDIIMFAPEIGRANAAQFLSLGIGSGNASGSRCGTEKIARLNGC